MSVKREGVGDLSSPDYKPVRSEDMESWMDAGPKPPDVTAKIAKQQENDKKEAKKLSAGFGAATYDAYLESMKPEWLEKKTDKLNSDIKVLEGNLQKAKEALEAWRAKSLVGRFFGKAASILRQEYSGIKEMSPEEEVKMYEKKLHGLREEIAKLQAGKTIS